MTQEISIHEVDENVLRAELGYLVQYLRRLGHDRCEVGFGWAWGMEYPPTAPWQSLPIPLENLEAEVRKPEDAGLGGFGRDDVTIRIFQVDCEFLFCHHSGIHLTSTLPSQIIQEYLTRWHAAGFTVVERNCPSEP